ncbi:MAG: hypothetical protein ACLUEK_11115 [Oscillospiraceae bacterium]
MTPKPRLWTRDFTIITLGTVVSMLGNAVSGFAISMLVLDYTGSVFLYTLYMVVLAQGGHAPSSPGRTGHVLAQARDIHARLRSSALYLGIFLLLRPTLQLRAVSGALLRHRLHRQHLFRRLREPVSHAHPRGLLLRRIRYPASSTPSPSS